MSIADVIVAFERVSKIRGPRLRPPYGVALVFAWLSEAWSRVSGRPALLTRMGLRTINMGAWVSSARAEREPDARFRPFEETARDILGWYRAAAKAELTAQSTASLKPDAVP